MMMADMPTYEYRCDNGHTFEITQSMSEDALESCTVCGAPAQRILFAPAVHFKGSGFYTTDYARKGNATKAVNGSDAQKSDAKDSKGSDSKGSGSKSDSGSSSSSTDSSSGSGSKAASKQN
jgi:putative FmdB family regulatory protein